MTKKPHEEEIPLHRRPGNEAMDRKHGTFTEKGVWRPDPAPTKSGIKREACKLPRKKPGAGKWNIV